MIVKRFFIYLILFAFVLSLAGCSENIEPSAYADYGLTGDPDTMELRMTAVQAMRDILSIEWTPAEGISYFNTAGRDKQFDYTPGTVYGGILYSGASSGLFQFMEFYDPKTGVLTYPGSGDELRRNIGSGCADSLLWSWATVSNSFSCGYYPSMMVYKNGFLPVGNYTYNFELQSYYMLPTKAIIEANGKGVILDAYSKVLPADALISSSVDHAMMVIENPTVVYTKEGIIDPDSSYVIIQDQRGGSGSGFLEENVDGRIIQYNSARSLKMTFTQLYEKNYIPVTVAEFIGQKPYDKASVALQGGECKNLGDFVSATIEANYPIAVINISAKETDGTTVELEKILINSASITGPKKTYSLSSSDTAQRTDLGQYSRIQVEVVVSTGERFIPIVFNP